MLSDNKKQDLAQQCFELRSACSRVVEISSVLIVIVKRQIGNVGGERGYDFLSFFLFRYQYYLQVKKEVLDGRLHCTVEQGIRLAGLAVQGNTHMHAQTSHVNNQPEGDRQHKRERVCTNSYFLRSS